MTRNQAAAAPGCRCRELWVAYQSSECCPARPYAGLRFLLYQGVSVHPHRGGASAGMPAIPAAAVPERRRQGNPIESLAGRPGRAAPLRAGSVTLTDRVLNTHPGDFTVRHLCGWGQRKRLASMDASPSVSPPSGVRAPCCRCGFGSRVLPVRCCGDEGSGWRLGRGFLPVGDILCFC